MKFPCLRVRELIYIVVYAALIAQAILFTAQPPKFTGIASALPGYVWVTPTDMHLVDPVDASIGEYEYVDALGRVFGWRPSVPLTGETTVERAVWQKRPYGYAIFMSRRVPRLGIATLEALGHPSPDSPDVTYHLVHKSALRGH